MEHSESLKTKAAERYLLDEMSTGERDAFEDHYFDCVQCASDVRDGAQLMAAGREVVREPAATVHDIRPRRSWTQWVPQAAAASVVSAAIGWYGAVNAGIMKVAAIEPLAAQYDLLTEAERGPETGPTRIPAGGTVTLSYAIPPSDEAVSYVSSVRDSAGKTFSTETYSLEQSSAPILLVVRALPRGNYQVVIEGVRKGGNRFPIAKSPFEVVTER